MKKIRKSVFETNSSSTHSIAITPEGWEDYVVHNGFERDDEDPYIPIEVREGLNKKYSVKTCVITTSNWYKRTNGYFYISGDLEKIQFLVSSLSYFNHSLEIDLTPSQLPYFNQIGKAIGDYIKEKYDIYYIDVIKEEGYAETNFINNLIGWGWNDEENKYTKEEVYNIITKVISDDKIVFICHSDESGPYPEDIDLIAVEDFKDLLKDEV